MRKIVQLMLIASSVVVVLAAPAVAQEYPPPSVGGITVERGDNGSTDPGDPGDPGASAADPGGTLAFTGADTVSLVLVGAGVAALGAALVIGARRRHATLAAYAGVKGSVIEGTRPRPSG
jgi:LPXTG-motif cell wall-anchored protein